MGPGERCGALFDPNAQRVSRSVEQRADRSPAHPHTFGKLLVAEPAHFAKQQRLPLRGRKLGDGLPGLGQLGPPYNRGRGILLPHVR